jgi:hypothetical protein
MVKVNGFEIIEKDSFPPKKNPFHYDEYHMGTSLGNNLMVMYSKHSNEQQPYIILVNIDTGKRIKILIEKENNDSDE